MEGQDTGEPVEVVVEVEGLGWGVVGCGGVKSVRRIVIAIIRHV